MLHDDARTDSLLRDARDLLSDARPADPGDRTWAHRRAALFTSMTLLHLGEKVASTPTEVFGQAETLLGQSVSIFDHPTSQRSWAERRTRLVGLASAGR